MSRQTAEVQRFHLRRTFEIALAARGKGNHPFGALLAGPDGGVLLEAENTVVTGQDCTGHAETNLMRAASGHYPPEFLSDCTLYTSTEPCAMCAGAIFWGNVGRVVFGLSGKALIEMVGEDVEEVLDLTSGEVFARGRKAVELIGPLLEQEAAEVHSGFWKEV